MHALVLRVSELISRPAISALARAAAAVTPKTPPAYRAALDRDIVTLLATARHTLATTLADLRAVLVFICGGAHGLAGAIAACLELPDDPFAQCMLWHCATLYIIAEVVLVRRRIVVTKTDDARARWDPLADAITDGCTSCALHAFARGDADVLTYERAVDRPALLAARAVLCDERVRVRVGHGADAYVNLVTDAPTLDTPTRRGISDRTRV